MQIFCVFFHLQRIIMKESQEAGWEDETAADMEFLRDPQKRKKSLIRGKFSCCDFMRKFID